MVHNLDFPDVVMAKEQRVEADTRINIRTSLKYFCFAGRNVSSTVDGPICSDIHDSCHWSVDDHWSSLGVRLVDHYTIITNIIRNMY